MSAPIFYIDISIQTADGPRRFGRFELGSDRQLVKDLFSRLKGSTSVDPKDMLYIELMEVVNGLPMNMDIITCDLQELGTNAMLITQENFRLANIKAGS